MQVIKPDILSTENQGPHQRQNASITAVNAVSRTNYGDQNNTPVIQPSYIDTSIHSIPVKGG